MNANRTIALAGVSAILAVLSFALGPARAAESQPAREADVIEFVAKLEEGRGSLEGFCEDQLPAIRDRIRELTGEGGLSAAASQALLARLDQAEGKLAPALEAANRYAGALGLAQNYADLKEKTVFVYETMKLAQQMQNPLQRDLIYLSAVLKKVEIPILDAPLKAYAEITEKLVLLTEKVRKQIESNLAGYHVGGSIPVGLNVKTRALFEFFGKDKSKYEQYEMAPQGPSHVYRPVAESGKRVMIWNEWTRTWRLVRPEATTPPEVERIYHDSLLTGNLLDADMLYRYTEAPTFERLQETRERARAIQKYLNGIDAFIGEQLFPSPVFVGAWEGACDEVELPFDKPWEFEARFAFDHAFRNRVTGFFKALHDGFCFSQSPAGAASAARVRATAVRFGMREAASWKCELTPSWILPVAGLPANFFAGEGWGCPGAAVGCAYNIVLARQGETYRATVHLEHPSLTAEDGWCAPPEAPPWRWKTLRARLMPTGKVEIGEAGVTVFVQEEEWATREYQDGRTEELHSLVTRPREFKFAHGFPGLNAITGFTAPPAPLEATWSRSKAPETPPAPCSFAGTWDVKYFNSPAATGDPSHVERWRVEANANEARALLVVRGREVEHAFGPLSDGGREWNPVHVGGGLRFEKLRHAPDCNRFAGTWSGEAPHHFALVATREIVPPEEAAPAGPREVVLELQGLTREIPVTLAAGGRLLVRRASAPGNPFVARLAAVEKTGLTLVAERTEPIAGPPRPGAANQAQVWEFRAAETARGAARIVIELKRPWEAAASIRYTIVVRFAEPSR